MKLKYDFGGWATKANMLCSDGRTILRDAFKDQDGCKVPLLWNHQHNDPSEVLGHAILENRDDGVYAYASFNDTENGQLAKAILKHGDIESLSIWANQLKQVGGNVSHGVIREVSLVLAGANPGAYIDSVMAHSDNNGINEEAAIYTGEGIELFHSQEISNSEADVEAASDEAANVDEDSQEDAGDEAGTEENSEAAHCT